MIDVPVSIIASGADIIVDNAPLRNFCWHLHQANNTSPSTPFIVEGAFHELHLETDELRGIFIEYLHDWVQSEQAMNKKNRNDRTNEHDDADEDIVDEREHEPKGLYKYYPMKFVFQFKDFLRRLSQLS